MSLPGLLAASAIVMAHPDDEVLWASSVLARVDRVILVFGAVPSKPALGAGRAGALAEFPRPVAHLALPESEAFGSADWPLPAECSEGLATHRRPWSMAGYSAERYRANHARLAALLCDGLAGVRNVITHGPWGEYGHEEHVQVLRAVEAAQAVHGYRIWVPGYVSEKSAPLMRRHLARLGPPTPALPTDPALGGTLQALYQRHGCWTWFDDYAWPEREVFYPLLDEPRALGRGEVFPMNLLEMGWHPRPTLLRRAARRLLRGGRLTT